MLHSKNLFIATRFLVISLTSWVLSCEKSHDSYLTISVVPYMSQGNQLKLSLDGTKLAGMFANGDIHVWDAMTGNEIAKLSGIENECDHCLNDIAWTPDGSKLVATDNRNQAVVWDVAAQKSLRVLKHGGQDTGQIDTPLFSADGRFLATRWSSEVIYVWDLDHGTQIHRHYAAAPPTFSRDGNTLLLVGDVGDARPWNEKGQPNPHNVAYLWNFVADSEKAFSTKNGFVAAGFSGDESQIFLIEGGSPIKLETWNVSTQTIVQSVDLVPSPENGITLTYQFSDDGKRLLLNWSANNQRAQLDEIASLWDVDAGIEIAQIHLPSLYSKAFFIDADGSLIYTYTVDPEKPFYHKGKLWNGKTGDFFLDLYRHYVKGDIQAPFLLAPLSTWSTQKERIVIGFSNGDISFWDLNGVSP